MNKKDRQLVLKKKRVTIYTMRSVVDDTAKNYKNRIALKIYDDDTTEISFKMMKSMVDSFSLYLINKGFSKGDKIAILSENRPTWLIAYFGITSIGCIAVPILPEFSEKEVLDILTHSEAKGIVVSSKYVDKAKNFVMDESHFVFRAEDLFHITYDEIITLKSAKEFGEIPGIDASHKFIKEVTPKENAKKKKDKSKEVFLHKALKERVPEEDDIASIIYTSGTTGAPKGVMLTHKNLVWNADESTNNYVKIKKGYRVLSILPMSHVYSFTIDQLLTLLCGCEINYLVKPPAASILMQALKMVRPHIINTVPLLIEKIYKSSILPQLKNNTKIRFWLKMSITRRMILKAVGRKLKSTMGGKVKFFGIGGAPLDSDVEKFLYASGFPYAIGYGLTETSPLVAGCGPKNQKVGYIGKIVPHVSVRLGDVNKETGVGEIEVKGPNVMKGYYKNDELTKEVFTSDGYFKTGDLGYLDKKNRLSIRGRSKTMILGSGGENIYPEPIEAKFNNLDFVEETLVVPENGGLVAMIRLNLESFRDNMAMNMKDAKVGIEDVKKEAMKYLKSLRETVNKDLQKSSQIDEVELQEEPFKRTPTQKIKRFLYNRKNNNKAK